MRLTCQSSRTSSFVSHLIQSGVCSLRFFATEQAVDRAAMRGGERHVCQFGEEKPLLVSVEPGRHWNIEDREMNAMMRERVGEKGERFGAGGRAGDGGQFPEAAPAGAGLLFEQEMASARDPGAIFAERDGFRAGSFDGKKLGIGGAAVLARGTEQALRLRGCAKKRAEFHERGGVETPASFWEQSFGGFP